MTIHRPALLATRPRPQTVGPCCSVSAGMEKRVRAKGREARRKREVGESEQEEGHGVGGMMP
jgi:hypothetical protein